ncbi:Nuclear transport factor 2 [Sporothrix epigloea]|uniref:Nuclear transport factor 2 n=1 Tax=Sporothrix epigloea TaxID=1892477 RepID=A0ABP0DWE1_9PEZI
MADSYESIAKQFVEFYYTTFDADRSQLASLYRENSMLTFQTASVLGVAGIVEKLKSLPFQRIKHVPQEIDAQPSFNNGVLVFVTGQLQVDEEERPMNFSQVFQLSRDDAGQYYVHNDIFKLIFG